MKIVQALLASLIMFHTNAVDVFAQKKFSKDTCYSAIDPSPKWPPKIQISQIKNIYQH